jgi:hypothetical protein
LLLLPSNSEPNRNAAIGTVTTLDLLPGKEFFALRGTSMVDLVASVVLPGKRG